MELTAVSQMGRRSRAAITAIPPGNSPQKSGTIPQADRLSLSRQTASFLQEQDRLAQEVTKIIQRFTDNGETEKQGMTEDEMLAEELKVKERCQKIMSRLMKGDKVPPKDMQYLAQNDMEAYKLAMAARKPAAMSPAVRRGRRRRPMAERPAQNRDRILSEHFSRRSRRIGKMLVDAEAKNGYYVKRKTASQGGRKKYEQSSLPELRRGIF